MVLKPDPAAAKPAAEPFTVAAQVVTLRQDLCALPDGRKGGTNQRDPMGDAALGAFSVFFMQRPSFLDVQVRLQKARGRNNPSALFGIEPIPNMQQIRNLLDPVSPAQVAPLFMVLVEPMLSSATFAACQWPQPVGWAERQRCPSTTPPRLTGIAR
jgi:hypothetical protein